MKKTWRFTFVFMLALSLLLLAACGKEEEYPTQITNGGFEVGTAEVWTGWTKTETAFSPRGIVNDLKVNGITVDKTGEFWFSGTDGGTQQMVGTLTSSFFKLTGTGKIAFKMGAAKNQDKIFVEFFEKDNATALLKITNTDYDEPFITDQMIRRVVDLSAHLNKIIYIRVTDSDNTDDYGYVNLDDFVVCLTEAEVTAMQAERDAQIEAYGEPEFEEDPTSTTITNGGFETGDLTGWKQLSGTAFGGTVVVPTSQFYWTDRMVYGEGDYYLDGNNNAATAESAVGAIRSTKFTLAGDGWISFMIGSGPTNCYISINDGTTDAELIQVTNTTFNDPGLPLTLRRVYVDASEYLGDVLYISIVDNNPSSGFAFINADDFRVSMTEVEVKALMKSTFQAIMAETYTDSYNSLAHLQEYYTNYDYPFELPALMIETEAEGFVTAMVNDYNLTALMADVVITYGETAVPAVITKVVLGETEFTTGFDAFDFDQEGTYVVHYGTTYESETVTSTFNVVVSADTNVANGGFETGDMTGWSVVFGDIINGALSAETFWGEMIAYNQQGNYHFDGWTATSVESAGYTLRSGLFTLSGTGWVSFMMGGKAAAVRVVKEDGTVIGYFTNYRFKDFDFPYLANGGRLATMTRYFADLSAYLGEKVYVELIDDPATAGWAVSFFDDINFYHTTVPDVANGFDTVAGSTKDSVQEPDVNIEWEMGNNGLIINGGFETGDMTGWTSEKVTVNAVISQTHYWNEKLPYNQSGDYHFDGWTSGVAESEQYSLRSTNFTLHGTGFISLKMGANAAAVKVYLADGTQIGLYKQNRFSDTNFPSVDLGGSWADMGTYFIDLSAYLGQELYLELCDIEVAGWAVAFFDEVVTYYAVTPDIANGFDTVTLYSKDTSDQWTVERTHNIPWQTITNQMG
ncbi:MAG: hypothetical protein AB7V00_02605 [Bacilli bacterium]